MLILKNVSSPELLDQIRRITLSLNIEYLQDVDAPKNVDDFIIWHNPPHTSSKKMKRKLVAGLVANGIINEAMATFIFKEMKSSKVVRPAIKTKKLIVSLLGGNTEADKDIKEVQSIISKWSSDKK